MASCTLDIVTGRRRVVAVLGALTLLVPAVPASAQDANTRDPSSDSPSGDAYDIPLDSGRDDAAPSKARKRPKSRVRSDEGLGSSTQVPGATTTPAAPAAEPEPEDATPRAPRERKRSASRKRSAKPAPSRGRSTEPAPARERAAAKPASQPRGDDVAPSTLEAGGPSPSTGLALGLLGLAAIVALALAGLGRRPR
jgi:hypothetical protein